MNPIFVIFFVTVIFIPHTTYSHDDTPSCQTEECRKEAEAVFPWIILMSVILFVGVPLLIIGVLKKMDYI